MTSGKWKVESEKWKVKSEKWKVENCKVKSGKWKVKSEKWQSEKWKVESEKVKSGKWKVKSGKWKMKDLLGNPQMFLKTPQGILRAFKRNWGFWVLGFWKIHKILYFLKKWRRRHIFYTKSEPFFSQRKLRRRHILV